MLGRISFAVGKGLNDENRTVDFFCASHFICVHAKNNTLSEFCATNKNLHKHEHVKNFHFIETPAAYPFSAHICSFSKSPN
jgi:hypothetical protein